MFDGDCHTLDCELSSMRVAAIAKRQYPARMPSRASIQCDVSCKLLRTVYSLPYTDSRRYNVHISQRTIALASVALVINIVRSMIWVELRTNNEPGRNTNLEVTTFNVLLLTLAAAAARRRALLPAPSAAAARPKWGRRSKQMAAL
eukprot:6203188-Pleurochrysis_carterae.AAC.2